MDDAYNRRLKMFYLELQDDITQLEKFYLEKDHNSIKNFAHKYIMRLTYFKFSKALKYCQNLDALPAIEGIEDIKPLYNGLLLELEIIQNKKGT